MKPELLWALIGAGLGGVGGAGLSKYLNPEDNLQAVLMGLGGAGVGGGAGYGAARLKQEWDAIPSKEEAQAKADAAKQRGTEALEEVNEASKKKEEESK
jgi:hypothetical protein